MLPGIPDSSPLAPDASSTGQTPVVRPASVTEHLPPSGEPVVPAEVRSAAHVRPEPPPRRTVLPWVVFAVLAVLVVSGTTLWSSTLHVPTTPIESLTGGSTTQADSPAPAPPPAPTAALLDPAAPAAPALPVVPVVPAAPAAPAPGAAVPRPTTKRRVVPVPRAVATTPPPAPVVTTTVPKAPGPPTAPTAAAASPVRTKKKHD